MSKIAELFPLLQFVPILHWLCSHGLYLWQLEGIEHTQQLEVKKLELLPGDIM